MYKRDSLNFQLLNRFLVNDLSIIFNFFGYTISICKNIKNLFILLNGDNYSL